jgi:hypothetical protein
MVFGLDLVSRPVVSAAELNATLWERSQRRADRRAS